MTQTLKELIPGRKTPDHEFVMRFNEIVRYLNLNPIGAWAGLTPSANAQSLVTAANYAAMRTLLDLEAGTDFYSIAAADAAFQPLDAFLTDIATLTDPGADRILFWDDSVGDIVWLELGTNLSITGTTLNATGGSGDVVGPASSTDNAIARFDSTTGKLLQNSASTIDDNGTIFPVATAAGFPSIQMAEGTLMTTPTDGAVEMDANCVYMTTDAGNRGYVPIRHFIRADATRTLPNDSNENAIFNSPTNGRITLEAGLYKFEALISVTSMSATSGNALIDWLGAGTAVCAAWLWTYAGKDGTNATAAALNGATRVTQDSASSVVTAGTGTEMFVNAMGTFEVTTGGTMIPSIDLVTAIGTATIAIGSYFMVERIGSTSTVSVGQWD